MNNKGQSLILFVLIVPVIVLILISVYKIGELAILQSSLNNINYLAVDYAISNLDNEDIISKTEELIAKNIVDYENLDVSLNDNKIYITITKKMDGIKVTSSYVGYLVNEQKIIEKNK